MSNSLNPAILTLLAISQVIIISLYVFKSFTLVPRESDESKNSVKESNFIFHSNRRGQDISKMAMREKTIKINGEEQPILFIAIMSYITFTERRDSIRNSWLKDCSSPHFAICKFFTDGFTVQGKPITNETRLKLEEESKKNGGDLAVIDSASGRNFAVRLLMTMEYAKDNFDFDFFLRIDDDHYLCLDRLLGELPHRPKERLYWGHMHCQPGVTRIDEGWVMLTEDLVYALLKSKLKLLCSRFADQSLAMWIYKLMRKKKIYWFGDQRIFHHPPVSTIVEFKIRKEICHSYISLHGSYPIEMNIFHLIHEREREIYGETYDIPPVVDLCPYRRDSFNWKWFDPTYYTVPVPCRSNPIWKDGGDLFLGRSFDFRKKMKQNLTTLL